MCMPQQYEQSMCMLTSAACVSSWVWSFQETRPGSNPRTHMSSTCRSASPETGAGTLGRSAHSARLPSLSRRLSHSGSRSPSRHSISRRSVTSAPAAPVAAASEEQLLSNLSMVSTQAGGAAETLEAQLAEHLSELKESLANAAAASGTV